MPEQFENVYRQIQTLYYVGSAAFGLCVTGFFYLMRSKDKFEEKIEGKIAEAVGILTEIKDSLIGTLDKRGLKAMIYEHDEELKKIKGKDVSG